MANIAEDVKAIIVEKLGVDASEVTETGLRGFWKGTG